MTTKRLSSIARGAVDVMLTATLTIETGGAGFVDITREVAAFLNESRAGDGLLTVFLRHTSASLAIQENADPDVQADLMMALRRLAPENAGWIHDTEGSDDMPAHVKAMLTDISLCVPVRGGDMVLGAWQGLYLIEHRVAPHRREIVVQFIGASG